MTNVAVAIIYFAIMIVTTVFIMVTYTGGNRKRPVARAFLLIAMMTLCWVVCEILYRLTQDATVARILYDLKIPFVALASTATVPFVLYFYGMDWSAIIKVQTQNTQNLIEYFKRGVLQ